MNVMAPFPSAPPVMRESVLPSQLTPFGAVDEIAPSQGRTLMSHQVTELEPAGQENNRT
jgi:hypothetical protein